MPEQAPSPRARFVSEVQHGRYVEVYGPKPKMREAFSVFLDEIAEEPSLMIRTLREALPSLRRAASCLGDYVPLVG